jgi:hypothetical protein
MSFEIIPRFRAEWDLATRGRGLRACEAAKNKGTVAVRGYFVGTVVQVWPNSRSCVWLSRVLNGSEAGRGCSNRRTRVASDEPRAEKPLSRDDHSWAQADSSGGLVLRPTTNRT